MPTIPIVKQRDYTLSNSSAVGAFAYCPLRFALHGLQMTVTLIQPSSRPDQTNSETRVFCRRHSNIWTKIQNFIILPSLRRKLTPDHGVLNATGVNRLTLVARPPSRLEYFLLARTMPHQKRGFCRCRSPIERYLIQRCKRVMDKSPKGSLEQPTTQTERATSPTQRHATNPGNKYSGLPRL